MRTTRLPSKSNQGRLPSRIRPNKPRVRANRLEPPWGIELQTYALRDSPAFDGGRWLVSSSAGALPKCPRLATTSNGRR
jgi:hypothetical protein